MLIDSHCHLPKSSLEVEQILKDAQSEGVQKLICIATDTEEFGTNILHTQKFEDIYTTVGIYPHNERNLIIEDQEKFLRSALSQPKVVGVGECGIDITEWRGGRSVEDQILVFEMQIRLAVELDLPIVIHNRNGDDIVLEVLNQYKGQIKGVAHCFASSWEVAQKFLDLGFYISFSGLITYPSRKELLETVLNVPNDRFVVETDSPYLPPQGFRGKNNEPKYVKIVAQKVAEIKGISLEAVSDFSYHNTSQLFNL